MAGGVASHVTIPCILLVLLDGVIGAEIESIFVAAMEIARSGQLLGGDLLLSLSIVLEGCLLDTS